jgi:dTDP-4-dehydrorhamnose reductase
MNVAVVGATGQVGHDVVDVARRRPGVTPVVVDRAVLDLDDPDGVTEALAPLDFDVLVNCAGFTAVDAAETEAVAAFRLNAYGPERLARACAAAGARYVHLSTDYVFGGDADRPYRPDDPPGPINVYGASKLAGEALVRQAWGGGSVIVRTSSVFGLAGAARPGGNFVETILRLSAERERLEVVADTRMAPTYSRDLAGALLTLLDSGAPPGVYHVTNRGQASWLEPGGGTPPVDPVSCGDRPSAARRPRYSVLDTGATDALTGPLPTWQDALGRYIAEAQRSQRSQRRGGRGDAEGAGREEYLEQR